MELIIGLIVIAAAGYFVFFRKKDEPLVVSAPYKVDAAPAPVAEPEAVVVVEAAPEVAPEVVAEAAVEAPAKKTRKPRAPKAGDAVPKKPVAKKPVAKKPAAKKPAARTATRSKKV